MSLCEDAYAAGDADAGAGSRDCHGARGAGDKSPARTRLHVEPLALGALVVGGALCEGPAGLVGDKAASRADRVVREVHGHGGRLAQTSAGVQAVHLKAVGVGVAEAHAVRALARHARAVAGRGQQRRFHVARVRAYQLTVLQLQHIGSI